MSDGAYVCINCGAALAFAAAPGGELPATAACSFCGVINDRAQMDLIRDRADARRNELAKSGRQRFLLQVVAIVSLSAAVLAGIAYTRTSATLSTSWAEVERARSQVRNVAERQHSLQARLANAEAGPGKDAELQGAENRVHIERGRFDKAAATYNADVGTGWARLCARVKGLPTRAEPSTAEGW